MLVVDAVLDELDGLKRILNRNVQTDFGRLDRIRGV